MDDALGDTLAVEVSEKVCNEVSSLITEARRHAEHRICVDGLGVDATHALAHVQPDMSLGAACILRCGDVGGWGGMTVTCYPI